MKLRALVAITGTTAAGAMLTFMPASAQAAGGATGGTGGRHHRRAGSHGGRQGAQGLPAWLRLHLHAEGLPGERLQVGRR